MKEPIQEPPTGCVEIPGFILPLPVLKLWFTQTGELTNIFQRRGVWPTVEAALDARDKFTKELE